MNFREILCKRSQTNLHAPSILQVSVHTSSKHKALNPFKMYPSTLTRPPRSHNKQPRHFIYSRIYHGNCKAHRRRRHSARSRAIVALPSSNPEFDVIIIICRDANKVSPSISGVTSIQFNYTSITIPPYAPSSPKASTLSTSRRTRSRPASQISFLTTHWTSYIHGTVSVPHWPEPASVFTPRMFVSLTAKASRRTCIAGDRSNEDSCR